MYQVIARKYRPQRFTDVVSQDHVKQTIANAIEQNRIGHGYIFSGPRGTGKTTMARILAMCLNCTDGPSIDPDPDDPVCKEIAAGSTIDVVEIDAASNRRIDDIRELRESVRYRPARDRYKIFIIDEAHQITTDAFNALLKTLEEPPEWAVFILCTTEPQAIPATIHSRCQSFQFRTVDLDQVVERLRWICEQEGVETDDDALVAIALAGDGSIRDSESTLDQAIASCGAKLDADQVRNLLGAIPSEVSDRILRALKESDAPAMLDVVDRSFREGRHSQQFIGELCRQFRNLMVMKIAGADTKLVAAGSGERARAAAVLADFSQEDLSRYTQILLDLYRELQSASQSRFRMELGLLKLVYAGRLRPLEEVIAELGGGSTPAAGAGLKPPVTSGGAEARSAAAVRPPATTAPKTAPSPKPTPPPPVAARAVPAPVVVQAPEPKKVAPVEDPSKVVEGSLKERLLAAMLDAGEDFAAEALRHAAVEANGAGIVLRPSSIDRTTIELTLSGIETAAKAGGLGAVKIGDDLAEAEAPAQASSQPSTNESSGIESDAAKRALADPDFQAFQERLPGQIREVRNLREYSS
jgi:DNA polymerase-3 subunit gamma/tau